MDASDNPLMSILLEEDQRDYDALVADLESQHPLTSGKGMDFQKIRGNFAGRTAKAVVLHLACTGWSVAEIAAAVGHRPGVVGRYLAEAITEASPLDDVEILRNHELRKLDMQEKFCWEKFHASCQPEESTHEVLDKDGEVRELKSRKGQSGNPAYQRLLTEISKRRAALLGLDRPAKVQVDKTERRLQIQVVEVKTREDALALEGPDA